jgi:hypothetical protein
VIKKVDIMRSFNAQAKILYFKFCHAVYQIALDPYTEFLDAIWGEA